jgi:hypothetical protein
MLHAFLSRVLKKLGQQNYLLLYDGQIFLKITYKSSFIPHRKHGSFELKRIMGFTAL